MRREYYLSWLWKNSHGIRIRVLFSGLMGGGRVICGLWFVYVSKDMVDIATGVVRGSLSVCTVWLILLVVCGIMFKSIGEWIAALARVKVQNVLRQQLFDRLLQSRWTGVAQFHSGDVQSRLGEDVRNVVSLLTGFLPSLAVSSTQLLVSFVFLLYLDSTLALIAALGMVVFLLCGKMYAKQMRALTHRVLSVESAVQSLTQESVQYRVVVKTLELVSRIGDRLMKLQSELYDRVKHYMHFSVFSRILLSSGFSGGYLLAFLWGCLRLQEGIITFGVMTAFLQLVGQMQRPIVELTRLVSVFATTLASVDRIIELEELAPEEQGTSILLDGYVGVRLNDVCFGYDNRLILENFSYDFLPGSVTAVLGGTGTGKTTLLRLILALVCPQSGKVMLYNSQKIIEVSAFTRGNFAYVPQGNSLFSGTIRENLLLGNPNVGEQQMMAVLYAAAADFVNTLPLGLDTPCGEQGGGLSEGQAQRIAIARSLLRPGAVLLLDEITSALDMATEKLLFTRLIRYASKKTIIFITHRKEITKGFKQLVLQPITATDSASQTMQY